MAATEANETARGKEVERMELKNGLSLFQTYKLILKLLFVAFSIKTTTRCKELVLT